jgi:hypothetical protein
MPVFSRGLIISDSLIISASPFSTVLKNLPKNRGKCVRQFFRKLKKLIDTKQTQCSEVVFQCYALRGKVVVP